MKLFISPNFRGPDRGEGGIRRIVEAQRKWLPTYGIEVVENLEGADIVASHAGTFVDVPVDIPWVAHMWGLYWAEYEWDRWCYELNNQVIEAMRRADHVTAPSEWVAQAIRRGMWLKPTVLPCGIDPEPWEGGSNGGYVLWNKTRVDPVCDPTPMDRVSQIMPKVQFVSTFGTQRPNVRLTGRLSFGDAREYIVHAGVYLCTSRETFGISTLEAMAAGVPIVGWAWGGQAEFIRHGETGWLVTPGDYDGLAEGINWALANRAKVGQAAKEDALKRFTWQHVMESYAKVYEVVLNKSTAQRKAPLVSVVIPCYKLAKFLPDAVRSVQAQTMKDWECIIVNDASPDNTREVAEGLAKEDQRIRVINNPVNLYVAGALNEGMRHSQGRYIIPVDADNMISPLTLQVLSGALNDDRSIAIAYGGAQFVLRDGKTPDQSVGVDGRSGWPWEFRYSDQISHRNLIPSTSMFRRSVWERTGGYRQRTRTGEDPEFWTRATSYGFRPKYVTPAVTLIYRQRKESMSHTQPDWDWTSWFPWSRQIALTPFAVPMVPPASVGLSWPVPSYEPSQIAVIIPVGHGHEAYLIDALDSVEAQTFRKWECIVVNDTGHPLSLAHSWVKVIDTAGRVGPGKARNIGIEASNSPLFLPLDADDYLQADALQQMYSAWQTHGGVVYSQWYEDFGKEGTKVYDPPEYDARYLIAKGCIHTVTALYPKSAWTELGGFDPEIPNWEDWDFQIGLAAKGICGTKIPLPLFTYRKYSGKRRDENYANFDRGRQAILKKWAAVWEGKEELMACKSCPGGGGGRVMNPLPQVKRQGQEETMADAVLLEYLSQSMGKRTFRGAKTGTLYTFGSDSYHRQKYVYKDDAPGLLAQSGLFREVVPQAPAPVSSSPQLQVVAPITPQPIPEQQEIASAPPEEETFQAAVEEKSTRYDIGKYSIKGLQAVLGDMTEEDIALCLAAEKEGQGRVTMIKLLEAAQRG